MPILTTYESGCLHALGLANDRSTRFIGLIADDDGGIFLDDACFFARNGGQRVAQILLVIIINGRDDAHLGLRDHIGGIQPAAQSYFKKQIIGRLTREGEESSNRGDLEKSDGFTIIGGFTLFQKS